jgi:hypothetical protein
VGDVARYAAAEPAPSGWQEGGKNGPPIETDAASASDQGAQAPQAWEVKHGQTQARSSHGTGSGFTPGRTRKTQAIEDGFHTGIAALLDYMLLKSVVWSTFPAGGYALTKAAAGRLYRLGLKRGIPDILIWHNGKTYGIELKTPKGHLSPEQREMHIRLRAAGMKIATCRTVDEVIAFLHEHKIPTHNATTRIDYGHTQATRGGTPQSQEGAVSS